MKEYALTEADLAAFTEQCKELTQRLIDGGLFTRGQLLCLETTVLSVHNSLVADGDGGGWLTASLFKGVGKSLRQGIETIDDAQESRIEGQLAATAIPLPIPSAKQPQASGGKENVTPSGGKEADPEMAALIAGAKAQASRPENQRPQAPYRANSTHADYIALTAPLRSLKADFGDI